MNKTLEKVYPKMDDKKSFLKKSKRCEKNPIISLLCRINNDFQKKNGEPAFLKTL